MRILRAVVAAVIAAAAFAPHAFADVDRLKVERRALLRFGNRAVRVFGKVKCDDNERVELRVTVTQKRASATGVKDTGCDQDTKAFSVRTANASTPFAEGRATICVTARTHRGSFTTDTKQVCKRGKLEED